MAKGNTATPEVLEANAGRAVHDPVFHKVDDKEVITFEPSDHVNYITLADTAPVLIDDVPDVLDDLGLTEARQKMDTAHNEMIQKKYQLAVMKSLPGYLPEDRGEDRLEVSPFDVMIRKEAPARPTARQIQSAIDAKPYADPEYREQALEYFSDVLPVVEAENARLIAEINTARAELAEITQEYRNKLAVAMGRYQKFNAGLGQEWRKFEIANKGSHTPENHVVTSGECSPIVFIIPANDDQIEGLRIIRKAIEDYEAQANGNPEDIKRASLYNSRNANPIKSDTQGLNGRGFMASLFSRKK